MILRSSFLFVQAFDFGSRQTCHFHNCVNVKTFGTHLCHNFLFLFHSTFQSAFVSAFASALPQTIQAGGLHSVTFCLPILQMVVVLGAFLIAHHKVLKFLARLVKARRRGVVLDAAVLR